jgi:hypothetical protein
MILCYLYISKTKREKENDLFEKIQYFLEFNFRDSQTQKIK